MIVIRRAEYEDIPDIMEFIDEHWKKGHIFARNRAFFEWMYVENRKVNFFIAVDEKNNIYGIDGVILYNHSDTPDISGTLWKTIKSDNPVLGIDLDNAISTELNARFGCAVGLSRKARKVHELCGAKVEKMQHFYRLNDLSIYSIARVAEKEIPDVPVSDCILQKVTDIEEVKKVISVADLEKQPLKKDYAYIDHRYFQHPIYKYDVWKIVDNQGDSDSILVTRMVHYQGNCICKIIDYYGNIEKLPRVMNDLDDLLKRFNCEYIDVYSLGVPTDVYTRAGFVECIDDLNIIPNYFSPFEQRNVDIYAINPMVNGFRIFRGDGDLDRPS